jgi:hypothetical protein
MTLVDACDDDPAAADMVQHCPSDFEPDSQALQAGGNVWAVSAAAAALARAPATALLGPSDTWIKVEHRGAAGAQREVE